MHEYIYILEKDIHASEENRFKSYFTFTRFGMLGWIRNGDAIQNTLTTKNVEYLFSFCFSRTCAINTTCNKQDHLSYIAY